MVRKTKYAESRARYYIRAQAEKRGWQTGHVSSGGDFLEENEIESWFPDIGLEQDKPDFLLCLRGLPVAVIEAKNEVGKSAKAISEAIDYADTINARSKYRINLAIGASGNEDSGFIVEIRFLTAKRGWQPLTSNGFQLTGIPSKHEVELALSAGDATTAVTVPTQAEFIESAVEVSKILRTAKVEASHRPKVIGALVLAMYRSDIDSGFLQSPTVLTLTKVNAMVKAAVSEANELDAGKRKDLIEALKLSGAQFQQLEPYLGQIIAQLRRLNVRAVMHSGVDFLGAFYEAFLRYGYDNNALGIVFTPRHITRFCVDLVGVTPGDNVIDIACGTGGFLVSAYDSMINDAVSEAAKESVRKSLFGYDTNPTVWALALLNMYFRGDGKNGIARQSSLTPQAQREYRGKFSRSFLNPPFSQKDETETRFISAAISALRPGGLLAVVVKTGVFAHDDHKQWRQEFTRKHQVLAVISLPDDLFYPTAAPTSILIARALTPQPDTASVYLARVDNDGFEKLKGKRVERAGSDLPRVLGEFKQVLTGKSISGPSSMTILGAKILDGNEWCPQEWLPQGPMKTAETSELRETITGSVLRTATIYPELVDTLIPKFGQNWQNLPSLPYGGAPMRIDELFEVQNGKSSGEKNYAEGDTAYVSSGDYANSIVSLVAAPSDEIFSNGGISVTAFGQAALQPWPFVARGNGGSAVRVLIPKYRMTVPEMVWFTGQINSQRWRFFYARMAIKSRLVRLTVRLPSKRLTSQADIASITREFADSYRVHRAKLK